VRVSTPSTGTTNMLPLAGGKGEKKGGGGGGTLTGRTLQQLFSEGMTRSRVGRGKKREEERGKNL